MTDSKTLTFKHDGHVTKRTFRFEEVDENNRPKEFGEWVIGKLYVQKTAFDLLPPEDLKVTLEW